MFTNIRLLNENELPGDGLYNPLATAVRNMRSISDQLQVTMGNDGGIQLDFLPPLDFLDMQGSLKASFGGTLTRKNGVRKLTVEGGEVNWPYMAFGSAVQGVTVNNAASGLKVWCHITSSSASLQSGSSFPSFLHVYINGSTSRVEMNVRLLELVTVRKKLAVKYHHVGNVNFAIAPYFWISGYDPSKKQSLDHAEGGGLVWTDYQECDEE